MSLGDTAMLSFGHPTNPSSEKELLRSVLKIYKKERTWGSLPAKLS